MRKLTNGLIFRAGARSCGRVVACERPQRDACILESSRWSTRSSETVSGSARVAVHAALCRRTRGLQTRRERGERLSWAA